MIIVDRPDRDRDRRTHCANRARHNLSPVLTWKLIIHDSGARTLYSLSDFAPATNQNVALKTPLSFVDAIFHRLCAIRLLGVLCWNLLLNSQINSSVKFIESSIAKIT